MDSREFKGTSFHTIDSKGRLFIPENDRILLGDGFVLSMSGDLKTLAFYPRDFWEIKSEKLRNIPETDHKAHSIRRLIFGTTYGDLMSDSQGRVLLPQPVRQNFSFQEGAEAVLMGAGTSLELWTRKRYDSIYSDMSEKDIESMLDYINEKYG